MTDPSHTQAQLRQHLVDLGVTAGATLMVHASFRQVGWTDGGPGAAINALFDALGPHGTLVMPAASPQLAPQDAEDVTGPAFDKATTPTPMGALAEAFRTWPGTVRSDHPLGSVCANGANADQIVADHALAFCEGHGTPYEKLYDLAADTLLLGVGFNRCTSLHFAESMSARRRTTTKVLPVVDDSGVRWQSVPDMAADNSTHFPVVGDLFVETGAVRRGKVGQADSYLFATRALVDFAVPYFDAHLDPIAQT